MGSVPVLSVSLTRGLAADSEGAADLAPADALLSEPLHLRIDSRRCVQPQISEMDKTRGHRCIGGFGTPLP